MTVTRTQLEGCTAKGCGTQDTVTLDAWHGRRCAQHPPTYQPAHRRRLIEAGQPATADSYLNAWCYIELERAEATDAAA